LFVVGEKALRGGIAVDEQGGRWLSLMESGVVVPFQSSDETGAKIDTANTAFQWLRANSLAIHGVSRLGPLALASGLRCWGRAPLQPYAATMEEEKIKQTWETEVAILYDSLLRAAWHFPACSRFIPCAFRHRPGFYNDHHEVRRGTSVVRHPSGRIGVWERPELHVDILSRRAAHHESNGPGLGEWYYVEARLLPNVKGCGYPPMLNCSVFLKTYKEVGTNFSCYYSREDPSVVISHLDMWQVYMNLVYAMAIPIPSFIISVVYLAFAYFKIYNEDEDEAPLKKNAEAIDMEGESGTPVPPASGGITPAGEAFREDLARFWTPLQGGDGGRDEQGQKLNFFSFQKYSQNYDYQHFDTGGPVADI
ncbi:hypothetical protein NQ318_020665, partial [Aromia moschata]